MRRCWGANCDLDRQDLLTRPLADAGPTKVYAHVYVNDIVAIRDAEQSFSSDVFLRVEWRDPRLAHQEPAPCSVTFDQIWWPELQIMNRRSVQNIGGVRPLVAKDGLVSVLLRGYGDFSFKADLTEFPFDEQALGFEILSVYSDREVDFSYDPDRMVLAPELSVANFTVEMTGVEEKSEVIGSSGREHAGLSIGMKATRLTGFYTWQQLVPLFA